MKQNILYFFHIQILLRLQFTSFLKSIMAEHRKNPGMTKNEAKVAFLKKMQLWPTFGSVFFEAQVKPTVFVHH